MIFKHSMYFIMQLMYFLHFCIKSIAKCHASGSVFLLRCGQNTGGVFAFRQLATLHLQQRFSPHALPHTPFSRLAGKCNEVKSRKKSNLIRVEALF